MLAGHILAGSPGNQMLQRRPVNVKHGARCAMDRVGGRQKTKRGILMYRYKFAVGPNQLTAFHNNGLNTKLHIFTCMYSTSRDLTMLSLVDFFNLVDIY